MNPTSSAGFNPFLPGLELLQTLAQQGQQLGATASGLPHLSHWMTPSLSVEELDKRIQELKTVHFWLEQNSKALAATIQALEVQKMTLVTLKTMNVNLSDMANAFKAPSGSAPDAITEPFAPKKKRSFAGLEVPPKRAPQAKAADSSPPASGAASSAAPSTQALAAESSGLPGGDAAAANTPAQPTAPAGVDPMRWFGTLSEQFQNIANHAIQEVTEPLSTPLTAPLAAAAATLGAITQPKGKTTRKAASSGKAGAAAASRSAAGALAKRASAPRGGSASSKRPSTAPRPKR